MKRNSLRSPIWIILLWITAWSNQQNFSSPFMVSEKNNKRIFSFFLEQLTMQCCLSVKGFLTKEMLSLITLYYSSLIFPLLNEYSSQSSLTCQTKPSNFYNGNLIIVQLLPVVISKSSIIIFKSLKVIFSFTWPNMPVIHWLILSNSTLYNSN